VTADEARRHCERAQFAKLVATLPATATVAIPGTSAKARLRKKVVDLDGNGMLRLEYAVEVDGLLPTTAGFQMPLRVAAEHDAPWLVEQMGKAIARDAYELLGIPAGRRS